MNFDRAAVVTLRTGAGWFRAMASEIHRALASYGIKTDLVEAGTLSQFWSYGPGRDRKTIFVDFNKRVTYPERKPAVSIMVDHPCSLIKELAAEQSTDAVTGWVDASHVEAVKALGFKHRAMFLPHAGPDPCEQPVPMADREIDVFFAGSLEEPVERPASDGNRPLEAADLVFDAIELLEKSGAPVLPCILQILQQRGVATSSLARDDFAQLMTLTLKVSEMNRRIDVLASLPENLSVAVASNYLPAALRNRSNIRHLGHIEDFDQIRDLMRKSRIVLNTTSKFPFGSHERIWYAMAEGALVLTDSSAYMKQDFADGENILYLPQKRIAQGDLDFLAALASDDSKLGRMTERASAIYCARHSWEKRVPHLVEAMRAA